MCLFFVIFVTLLNVLYHPFFFTCLKARIVSHAILSDFFQWVLIAAQSSYVSYDGLWYYWDAYWRLLARTPLLIFA